MESGLITWTVDRGKKDGVAVVQAGLLSVPVCTVALSHVVLPNRFRKDNLINQGISDIPVKHCARYIKSGFRIVQNSDE